jgi:small subunit ribosomal protein S3
MAIEKTFVKEGIKESQIEDFLRKRFDRAGYSRTEIQRTPLGTRIIVFANKPGLVIGRSGRRVNEITEEIKKKFGFENPLIDVREVDNPFLDAKIVANRISKALERGIHYKRVCNFYIRKVMEAGAIGVQIEASGKLAGVERSRFQKFRDGFIAHSGDYAEKLVDKGYAQATMKPGIAGIKVKIMLEAPKEFIAKKGIEKQEIEDAPESEPEKTEVTEKVKGKKRKGNGRR